MIQSTPNNKAEKDHPDNLSLAGDGFDVVIKAKKAIDANPGCKNKVSCADILALATRDVIVAVSCTKLFIDLKRTRSKILIIKENTSLSDKKKKKTQVLPYIIKNI